MRIRYIGTADPTDNAVCEVYGHSFRLMEWVKYDAATMSRLASNPTFEFEDGEDDGKPGAEGPQAVSRGFGRYSIMDGDTEVQKGLDKLGAAAFNALSVEERVAFVAARQAQA
jgi:hypothetical protein